MLLCRVYRWLSGRVYGLRRENCRSNGNKPLVLALSKTKVKRQEEGAVLSLTDRLRAWWEGYDPDEIVVARAPDTVVAEEPIPEDPVVESEPDPTAWSTERRVVAEKVWGTGFTLPGHTEYILDVVAGMMLSSADSLLEIGANLGGSTAAIVHRFGVYVTALERDADLRRAALNHAIKFDVDPKISFEPFDNELPRLRSDYFRGALIRETLFTIEDKEAFLKATASALKYGSQLVLLELFPDAGSDPSGDCDWTEFEGREVFSWTLKDAEKMLTNQGFLIRSADDESESYRKMAVNGWQSLLNQIDNVRDPQLAEPLITEAQRWVYRVGAVDAGRLRYGHIVAIKQWHWRIG